MIQYIKKYKKIIFIIIGIIIFLHIINLKPCVKNTHEPFNSEKNALVIVEPRAHKLLKQVIENFDKNMDSSWDLYLFYGKSHLEYAEQSTININRRNKFLLPLETDNLDANQYNNLFKQTSFWNKVDAENILVFQTDVVLCGDSQYKIQDFLKYQYIGCPYNNQYIGKDEKGVWGKDHHFYGIGGLSFRKKSFMMKCIEDNPSIDGNFPEDVLFSNCVASGNKPENATILNQFCTQFYGYEKSFGIHKPVYLRNKNEFYNYCPEGKILE